MFLAFVWTRFNDSKIWKIVALEYPKHLIQMTAKEIFLLLNTVHVLKKENHVLWCLEIFYAQFLICCLLNPRVNIERDEKKTQLV